MCIAHCLRTYKRPFHDRGKTCKHVTRHHAQPISTPSARTTQSLDPPIMSSRKLMNPSLFSSSTWYKRDSSNVSCAIEGANLERMSSKSALFSSAVACIDCEWMGTLCSRGTATNQRVVHEHLRQSLQLHHTELGLLLKLSQHISGYRSRAQVSTKIRVRGTRHAYLRATVCSLRARTRRAAMRTALISTASLVRGFAGAVVGRAELAGAADSVVART